MPRKSTKKQKDVFKLSKLNGLIIDDYWLESITIAGDGTTELSGSWEELILLLFGMIYKELGGKATKLFVKNNVLSNGVNINDRFIDYSKSGEHIKVYKLSTGQYIELKRISSDYSSAIKGLIRAIGKKEKDVTLSIKPIGDDIREYSNIDSITLSIEHNTLQDLLLCKDKIDDKDVVDISILGSKESVKSATQALHIISIWAESIYGPAYIQSAISSSEDEVGLTYASEVDKYDTRFTTVKFGNYYIYSSGNTQAIFRYMTNTLLKTGMAPDLIEIGYKKLKDTSK